MKKILLFFFLFPLTILAQDSTKTDSTSLKSISGKKIINHTTYDDWKSMANPIIAQNGKYIVWEQWPQVGDGWLMLYNTETTKRDSFVRGKSAEFLNVSNGYLVFKIIPQYKLTRKAKLDKKKPDDMPKDTIAVYDLTSKKIVKLGNVKSYSVNEFTQVIVAHLGKEKKVTPKLSKREMRKRKKHPPVDVKSEGTSLVIWDPAFGTQKKINNVIEYTVTNKSDAFSYVVQQKGKKDSSFVYFAKSNRKNVTEAVKVFETNGWTKGLAIDNKGEKLGFLSTTDTNKTNKLYKLFLSEGETGNAKILLDTTNKKIGNKKSASEFGTIYFSSDGSRMFFGIANLPKQEAKDTLTDDEKYSLDVWHWNDERIMTEQLKSVDRDKKKTWLTVYNFSNGDFTILENDTLHVVQILHKGDGETALCGSDHRYKKSQSWQTQVPMDYYTINLISGETKMILEKKTHSVSLSNTGKYFIWYEPEKKDWYCAPTETGTGVLITNNIDDNLFEDNNGLAELPYPYGVMGWSQNDTWVYIYSEFEVWKVQPQNMSPVICLTKNKGGEYNTDLRYVKLDDDEEFVDDKKLLFKSFNHHNKREGFWLYENESLRPLYVEDKKFTFYKKAKSANKIIYSKMDFQTYPDLLVNDLSFNNEIQISNVNPQQAQYAWGNVELLKWKSFEGHDLEGLLFTPEILEVGKKYPMIVYYYEKNSDLLHQYRSPRPSASTVNISEYVSNGYVIFIPDIVYKLGEPGKSAYDCIVSGTKYVLEKGFIDEKKMGLQGQSWGGYQTAFMVTQTDMYAAAMAGAAVGNMTSAYGGIRWESGLVRAFQYEKGQSRIGKTLWEDREAYIRNSPIFFLDKVKTPLLMMNNDADGAVPWYQGIELYNGLRRMGKNAWMLNYNNDAHNLTRRANQIDLSRRMLQFFNHYLKDEPMPEWMRSGLPAVNKGKVTGYEVK